jgi:hypothetical protein
MARKPKLPIDVTVGGVRRHVVHMDTKTWTEQEASGRLVHHVGKLLLDGPTPTKFIETPRPCTVCKSPTYTTTMLGRPIHDACEGWTNVMPDDVEARALFEAAVALGVKEVVHHYRHDTPKENRDDRRPRHAA